MKRKKNKTNQLDAKNATIPLNQTKTIVNKNSFIPHSYQPRVNSTA